MSTIQVGLPFAAPVSQTILPVAEVITGVSMKGAPVPTSVRIVGFFPITETEFTGEESTFNLASGTINVSSIRLPPQVTENRVPELMVAAFNPQESWNEAWRGHPSFVPSELAGYYSNWIMPVSTITYRHDNGILVGSLATKMDNYTWTTAPDPTSPTGTNATIKWAVSMSITNDITCSFFDFNWIDLFNAKPPAGVDVSTIRGLYIIPTEQPSGLPFKSAVLQHPEAGPNNSVIYNTVRLIRMVQNVAAGNYTFKFSINYVDAANKPASTEVTLTLTIV